MKGRKAVKPEIAGSFEKKQVFDDNNKRSNKHEMQQDALQRKFQQITLSGTSIVRMNGPVCQ